MRQPIHRIRHTSVVVAALILLALSMGAGIARATSAPTSTDTPAATQTPYPTQTPAATYTPYPSPTVTHHPTLVLSASQGMPATTLVIIGSDFPNGEVTLSWDGAYLARGTSADGYLHIDTTAPATAALGPHEVRAVGPTRTSASAFFTVAQTLHPKVTTTLIHALAEKGTVVIVNASGFAPNQRLTLSWDKVGGTALGAHVADDNGETSFDIVLGVDPTPGVGTHRLYAAGTHPTLSASTSFTVDPPPPPCGGWSLTVPTGLTTSKTFCIDPKAWVGDWLKNAATAGAARVGQQVSTGLTEQQDYTQIPALMAVFGTVQDLARDLFVVLFVAGALTWYFRSLGLGSPGDAAAQMVEGGLGLAFVAELPRLMGLYINAVNGASGMILANAGRQGADIIGTMAGGLINGDLLKNFLDAPTILGAIVLFVVGFFVLLILVAITRTIGTIFGAAIFLAAPVAVVCMVTPLTRSVAGAWARLWFSITLWGVSYAIALVADGAMLGYFAHKGMLDGGIQSLTVSIAAALVLYGAPKLGDALLGGGSSRALGIGHVPLLSTAINMATGAAIGGIAGGASAATRATPSAAGESAGGATPGAPTVTELSPALPALTSGGSVIEGEWGVLESAGV
jgi:hypothetical protein